MRSIQRNTSTICPASSKVVARDLAEKLIRQGTQSASTLCRGEKVLTIQPEPDTTLTLTTDKGSHYTKTIIIAIGAGAFTPNRLDAPSMAAYEGQGVFYFVHDKSTFAGKRLLWNLSRFGFGIDARAFHLGGV